MDQSLYVGEGDRVTERKRGASYRMATGEIVLGWLDTPVCVSYNTSLESLHILMLVSALVLCVKVKYVYLAHAWHIVLK